MEIGNKSAAQAATKGVAPIEEPIVSQAPEPKEVPLIKGRRYLIECELVSLDEYGAEVEIGGGEHLITVDPAALKEIPVTSAGV